MNKKNHRTDLSRSSLRLRKKLLWFFLALLVITGILVVLEKTGVTNFIKSHPTPSTVSSGVTPEEKQQADAANAETKKQAIDNAKDLNDPATSSTSSSKSVDLSAQKASDNTVTVFTTLLGYSDGSCLLTVTNDDKTTTLSASVIYQREASSCAGFSVPSDPLGKGIWTLNLAVTSGGTTNSKKITYEVK